VLIARDLLKAFPTEVGMANGADHFVTAIYLGHTALADRAFLGTSFKELICQLFVHLLHFIVVVFDLRVYLILK
jgi:hypothetical protein